MNGNEGPLPRTADMRCVLDREGRFLAAEPFFCKTLGWPLESLQSQCLTQWLHPDDRGHALAELARLGGDTGAVHFESRFRQPGDVYRWLAWTWWLQPNDQSLHAHVRDAAELRATHERAAACRLYLAESLPVMLHELSASLAALEHAAAYLDAMLTRTRGAHNRATREQVATIHQTSNRIQGVLKDIRDDAWALQSPPVSRSIDIEQLVATLVASYEPLYRKRGIPFEFRAIGVIPEVVMSDEMRLRVALIWLLETWARGTARSSSRLAFEIERRQDKLVFRTRGADIEPTRYLVFFRPRELVDALVHPLGGQFHVDPTPGSREVSLWFEIGLTLPNQEYLQVRASAARMFAEMLSQG